MVLIGRENELHLLDERLHRAACGTLNVVLLAGEPGIGKTRLLNAFARRALDAGAGVLRGGASEAEGMPPYLPFLEALGEHIRATPDRLLREQVGELGPILAAILPELSHRIDRLPASYPLPADQARLRLYEGVGAFLGAIATGRPLVLILDDLHWSDPASLDLLSHVARRQSDARLLLLGAYRAGEAEAHPALQHAIAELNRLRVQTTVSVQSLTEPQIGALASVVLGAPVDATLVRRVHAHSEGNPFFAEELLRGWQEAGQLHWRDAGDQPRLSLAIEADDSSLPAGIVAAIQRRIERMTPETVESLRAASIIGKTFESALLADVVGLEEEPVEERLREAARAALLRAGPDGVYTFSHDKIRECLYQSVTSARRRRVHGFIGRALEGRPEATGARRLAELAYHFARSGDRERGIVYASRAAADALRAYAAGEAVEHYRMALSLLAPDDSRRADLLAGLGDAAVLAGSAHDAVEAYAPAIELYRDSGDTLSAARTARRLGHAWWRREAVLQARDAFETALALVDDTPASELVYVLTDLASLRAVSLYEVAEGVGLSRRALDLARLLEDALLLAVAGRTLGALLVRANDLPSGVALLEEALALAEAVDNPAEAAECCAFLATAYMWQADIDRSRAITLRRLAHARRSHDDYQLRHVYTWLSVCSGVQGKMREARNELEQARAVVERLESPEPLAYLHFCQSAFCYFLGEYPQAEAEFRSMIDMFQSIDSGAVVWYSGFLGLIQAAQGKVLEARASMDALEALLATVPAGTMPLGNPLTVMCAASLAVDDRERLERCFPLLAAFQGQFHDMLCDRILGQIETRFGDWTAAHSHLSAAEAAARLGDLRWDLMWTMEARADLVLARGGRGATDRARAFLEQAVAESARLDNPDEQARLTRRLHGLGKRRTEQFPAGLSSREVEVLRHVAAGLSNREIAAALSVSEKTIENHLTHIYTKLDVDNRAAAAAFAVRHGLA